MKGSFFRRRPQTATGFSIELSRRVGQHFVNMYAPTALLVVISFVREVNDLYNI